MTDEERTDRPDAAHGAGKSGDDAGGGGGDGDGARPGGLESGCEVAEVAYRAGLAAWPGVGLSRDAFSAHVRGLRAAGHPLMTAATAAAHGADLFLTAACARGDAAALRFFDGILRSGSGVLARYGTDAAWIDDVLQRVRIHLLVADADSGRPPRIGVYDGRASLRAWLSVCTVRMGLYVLRERRGAREITGEWSERIAELPVGHPELEAVRARYADVFAAAWRSTCAELPARQRAVLRMCFAEGHSIESVAAAYAVHRVTVWRWLEEAKKRLLDGTRARLSAALPADAPGTRSLLELVGSQLELGLSQLEALAAAPPPSLPR